MARYGHVGHKGKIGQSPVLSCGRWLDLVIDHMEKSFFHANIEKRREDGRRGRKGEEEVVDDKVLGSVVQIPLFISFCSLKSIVVDQCVACPEMAEEVEKLWQKMRITDEEDESVIVPSEYKNVVGEKGKVYIMANVLTSRTLNMEAMMATMKKVWNRPNGLKYTAVGDKSFIGDRIGTFEDVDSDVNGDFWGRLLRIRIAIDIHKSLRKAMKLVIGGDHLMVHFKYERLPNFCGKLGHGDRDCEIRLSENLLGLKDMQHGP